MSWGDHDQEAIRAKTSRKEPSKKTESKDQMAGLLLDSGKRIQELEYGLLEATNFIAHLQNRTIKDIGYSALSEIGLEWLNDWQSLIKSEKYKKEIIKAEKL